MSEGKIVEVGRLGVSDCTGTAEPSEAIIGGETEGRSWVNVANDCMNR
jgi:hypothetical protein